ncbi:hypothetical protein M758_3G017500 [Ceratodon purpureus]|nr:hypothetical protein M758_3G017500 [Ceratodon purpureus]
MHTGHGDWLLPSEDNLRGSWFNRPTRGSRKSPRATASLAQPPPPTPQDPPSSPQDPSLLSSVRRPRNTATVHCLSPVAHSLSLPPELLRRWRLRVWYLDYFIPMCNRGISFEL